MKKAEILRLGFLSAFAVHNQDKPLASRLGFASDHAHKDLDLEDLYLL